MDGYYDHSPLVDLALPLVLTSPLRDFTRAVAYRTASLLGLPFHDIDRLIEHQVGKVIEQLVLEEGEQAYRRVEADCLRNVIGQRPSGVIALADQDTQWLGKGGSHDLEDCSLVVLDFELANLFWRIQSTGRERGTSQWHPLFEGMPQSVSEIRPFWSAWRSAIPESGLRLSADTMTVSQTSQWLQDWVSQS